MNSAIEEMELTPRRIVEYLDRYIVGQEKAKKSVAIALRNRIRRRNLSPEMAKEVAPKNILMVGPTGVGKTEIARRLAELVKAPFVKVEATKFTEVGYVGRDVESIIRDLAEAAVAMVKKRKIEEVQTPAAERAGPVIPDREELLQMPHEPTDIAATGLPGAAGGTVRFQRPLAPVERPVASTHFFGGRRLGGGVEQDMEMVGHDLVGKNADGV